MLRCRLSISMMGALILLMASNVLPSSAIKDVFRTEGISHHDMVDCMMNDLSRSESAIELLIKEKSAEYEIPKDFYPSQRVSLHDRCMLYSGLGGQRSEILEIQCEIDGVKELLGFVERFMEGMDVN